MHVLIEDCGRVTTSDESVMENDMPENETDADISSLMGKGDLRGHRERRDASDRDRDREEPARNRSMDKTWA